MLPALSSALQAQIEQLADVKSNKSDTVLTTDLEALLAAHATELDKHLEAQKVELLRVLGGKADLEDTAALDSRVGGRVTGLETVTLKGLKAVSDKVSCTGLVGNVKQPDVPGQQAARSILTGTARVHVLAIGCQ